MQPHMETKVTDPNAPASTLTLREFFASQALSGLCADGVRKADMAQFAVIVADDLIDQLNGTGGATP
jgi:hypothetical protein